MAVIEEPVPCALHYADGEDAEMALEQWAEEMARLEALRDPIVAGALAVKVKRERIYNLTNIARSTIDRIRVQRLPVAVDDMAVLVRYVDVLEARADRYLAAVPGDGMGLTELHGRAHAARMAAYRLRTGGGRWGGGIGDDAALLSLIVDLAQALKVEERLGGTEEPIGRGVRAEQAQILAEAAALRERGSAAFDRIDPVDLAQAEVTAAERSLRVEAEALGVPPERFAAMTAAERAQAWADLPDNDEDAYEPEVELERDRTDPLQ